MAVPTPLFQTISYVNNNIVLGWSAMEGLVYQVQYTVALSGGVWKSVGPPLTATNASMTFSDVLPTDSQRFYRLMLTP
jgi:hypothetical protein